MAINDGNMDDFEDFDEEEFDIQKDFLNIYNSQVSDTITSGQIDELNRVNNYTDSLCYLIRKREELIWMNSKNPVLLAEVNKKVRELLQNESILYDRTFVKYGDITPFIDYLGDLVYDENCDYKVNYKNNKNITFLGELFQRSSFIELKKHESNKRILFSLESLVDQELNLTVCEGILFERIKLESKVYLVNRIDSFINTIISNEYNQIYTTVEQRRDYNNAKNQMIDLKCDLLCDNKELSDFYILGIEYETFDDAYSRLFPTEKIDKEILKTKLAFNLYSQYKSELSNIRIFEPGVQDVTFYYQVLIQYFLSYFDLSTLKKMEEEENYFSEIRNMVIGTAFRNTEKQKNKSNL